MRAHRYLVAALALMTVIAVGAIGLLVYTRAHSMQVAPEVIAACSAAPDGCDVILTAALVQMQFEAFKLGARIQFEQDAKTCNKGSSV